MTDPLFRRLFDTWEGNRLIFGDHPLQTLDVHGHGHSRHFDSLLITKNTCLLAGKQAPRGDRRNPMHCTYDITVVAQRLFRLLGLQRARLTAISLGHIQKTLGDFHV
jgi:hypothetical protein